VHLIDECPPSAARAPVRGEAKNLNDELWGRGEPLLCSAEEHIFLANWCSLADFWPSYPGPAFISCCPLHLPDANFKISLSDVP